MDKSGEITLQTVIAIIVAVCAVFGVGFTIYQEYTTTMIAVVDGGAWKAPGSVVTDLKVIDVNKTTATDPNRMTAVDANAVASLYLVNIRNKGKHKMKNPQMAVPTALHWEVSWRDTKGEQKEEYSAREVIALPAIECKGDIDVTVWAASEATRPNARKILVTQDGYGEARLDIGTPVWELVQSLSQHIRKVLWIGIILVVVMWRRKLAAIGVATWRRLRRTPTPQVVKLK